MAYNYENFDFEKEFENIKNSIKRPNILLCGGTGVGKSSLINDLFNVDKCEVGNEGRPQTKRVSKLITGEECYVNFYDSEGYEVGKIDDGARNRYYETVISFIDEVKNEYPETMEKHVHEVWYCVSAGNKRFYDIDKRIISDVKNGKKVPVSVIVTKVDAVDEDELTQLIREIEDKLPDISVFTYSTSISEDLDGYNKYVQKDEIIQWALDNLDDSLKDGLIPSVKGSLEKKKEYCFRTIVPKASKDAALTVASTSFVPVPFSDSVPLMGIQARMAMKILNTFNLESSVTKVVEEILGTQLVSYIGKKVASYLASLIPLIGPAIKATLNAGVATSITGIVGVSITLLTEQYCIACIESGGSDNLPWKEYFTKDKLKEIIEYVTNHRKDYGI